MEKQNPTAHATVTVQTTKAGSTLLLVSVFTVPHEKPQHRKYRHEVGAPTEQVVSAALRSLGLASAWTWGRLL